MTPSDRRPASASLEFRCYEAADLQSCLALFDENCPEFFSPNERADYAAFLASCIQHYIVCLSGDRIVGAYGLYPRTSGGSALHWILLSPSSQGSGLGTLIMSRAMEALRSSDRFPLYISASHKSAPFFARSGAIETSRIADGWGPGMHRVEMQIVAG